LEAAEPRYVLQSPGLVENRVGLYVPLLEFNPYPQARGLYDRANASARIAMTGQRGASTYQTSRWKRERNVIIDEAPMLTEEMLAALIQVLLF
jgi:hypothetical protein